VGMEVERRGAMVVGDINGVEQPNALPNENQSLTEGRKVT